MDIWNVLAPAVLVILNFKQIKIGKKQTMFIIIDFIV